jgi:hypothetical protein
MLSVFAVGTMNFVDTVEATTWNKYDSGTFNSKSSEPGFKKKLSYITYIKGSKDIKMKIYGYKTKNNEKVLIVTGYFSKTGNNIKCYSIFPNGKTANPEYVTTKMSVKQFYKSLTSS